MTAQPDQPERTPEIHRETVSIGIDFRPVPVDMGDGTIWQFDPDPSPDKWDVLTQALGAFTEVQMDDKNPNPDDFKKVSGRLGPLTVQLTEAIGGLLTEPMQRKQFTKRGYSMFALQRLATVLMETLSGFPTK